jgi:hypothetical protein
MKRLLQGLAIALIASFALACAGAQAPAISPDGKAAIQTARTVGRILIKNALWDRYKIPTEATALVLADLDKSVIDPALNGGQFRLVNDEAAWKPVRDDLVSRASAFLVKGTTSNGVQLLSNADATELAGELIDGIAAAVKSLPAVKTTTQL